MGYRESYRDANQLLLRLAERLSPEAWASKKHIKGEVRHEHDHRHAFEFTLRAKHVLLLPEDKREQFIEAVETITERSKENEDDGRRTLPAGTGP